MHRVKFVLLALLLVAILSLAQSVLAQGDEDACSTIVQDALSITQEVCQTSTGRNQACYGNITLLAEPQPGIDDLSFQQQGDIVDVDMIRTLQLSSLNRDANEWGIAYLQLQTSIPDESPENVTLLLFGDVAIVNAVEPAPDIVTIEITSNGNLNVRGAPTTNSAIVDGLSGGDTVVADGRIEDGTWVRIRLEEDAVGWVFSQLISTNSDIMALDVVDPNDEVTTPEFGPLQAFFLETGVSDAPCETAPDSGLLIQTPEGVGAINISVNEVDIRLRSTAYVQSQAGNEMIVSLVEGTAVVTAQDTSVFVPTGTRVRIAMDSNSVAAGSPSDPEPYDNQALAALPVLTLPRSIEVATALTQEEIEANVDVTGEWIVVDQEHACDGFDTSGFSDRLGSGQLLTMIDDATIRGEPPEGGGFIIAFTAQFTDEGDYLIVFDNFDPPAGAPRNEYRLSIVDPNTVEIIRYFDIVRASTFPCTTILTLERAS